MASAKSVKHEASFKGTVIRFAREQVNWAQCRWKYENGSRERNEEIIKKISKTKCELRRRQVKWPTLKVQWVVENLQNRLIITRKIIHTH